MLSCEKVEKLLPGLVTGEPLPHDVREHLASCDACRDRRDRLASEIADVREDLAALAPSPFLEDAVVEAAHETESPEPTRRPWRYVAVAFVAAAALFLVVLLPRLQEGGANGSGGVPGGEGDGKGELVHEAGAIFVPPSVGEVRKARDENSRYWNRRAERPRPAEMAYETWPAGAPTDKADTSLFLAPAEEAHHRYVWGDPRGKPGNRTCTMETLPSAEGVFYLGSKLLSTIGGAFHVTPTGEILHGDKRWWTTPGTMQGEITVGSPDEGGAEARVRVLVSPGYSGTLLLEEPLAYALGLHQFEIPGDVDFQSASGESIPIEGRRARARIRIPELDFDQVVEVQVVRARPWMVKRGRRAREVGLLFPRKKPTQIVTADAIEGLPEGGYRAEGAEVHSAENGFEHLEIRDGTRRLVLGFHARNAGAVPLLPDVPLLGSLFDSADGVLVPRALDFSEFTLHVLEVGTVRLDGRWEPGANVTIARVWRGLTAIPSAEAVVSTQVDDEGRIAFPRLAGEAGRTLRMLVRTKDGERTFHDVVVAPELGTTPRLDLYLMGTDGTVRGQGWAVSLFDDGWRGDDVTGPPTPERVAALAEQLRALAARMGHAPPEDSTAEIVLHADAEAPWRMVQWVMQVGAAPGITIRRFRLGFVDGPESAYQRVDLPVDRGLVPDPRPERIQVRVILHRAEPDGPLVIRPGSRVGETTPWTWDELPERLRFARTEFARESATIHGLIQVPPPGLVTCAEALRLLAAFRQAGFEDVQLEGAPLR